MQTEHTSITPEEHQAIIQAAVALFGLLDNSLHLMPSGLFKNHCRDALHSTAMLCKHQLTFSNSGDACRHPVQSPDVVGQGGNHD